jgi:hypothetical protein
MAAMLCTIARFLRDEFAAGMAARISEPTFSECFFEYKEK